MTSNLPFGMPAGVEPKVRCSGDHGVVGQCSVGTRTLSLAGAPKHAGTTYEQEGIMRTDDGDRHIRADERAMRVSSADRARFWAGLNCHLETEGRSTERWMPMPARVLRRTTHDHE